VVGRSLFAQAAAEDRGQAAHQDEECRPDWQFYDCPVARLEECKDV